MSHEEPSSSSFNHGWTYDVFVSFNGEDTRYSFTGNLCNALDQKGINTFKDDTKLVKGEGISPALLKAIEESRIAIVVFSENYAGSSWCLDELVKIIECMKEKGQLVRPVFYYVDPSDVRKQRGSYGRLMAEHEEKLKNSEETVRLRNWRVALRQAANLSGWHFKNGYEFEFIQRITAEISSKLNRTFLHIADHPVGLNYRKLKVMSLLSLKSNEDACMVGIYGIGGIGKTTLVRAVYNSIANQFEGSCFLADVRENSMKYGLVQLQETLLSDLLAEKNLKLGDVNKGIPILETRLCRKKVLLILDDVDNLKQVRSLAGKPGWFGSGSRIIITTRNKHLLTTHGVERRCEVKELNDDEALELFSWNAFKKSKPDEKYAEMAKLVVQYAKGMPLALNVIGSDLFGKTIEEWASALKKYERIPSKEILEVLKVSYDNLDDNEKEIFLDIACFFKGNLVEDVEKTLDASRFYSKYGIGVLIDKSLVNIDEATRVVKMHDLIQDLGRDIARKDSPFDPGKRRRLWQHEDVLEVLTKDTGTDTIEGILLDVPNLKQEVQLRANVFKRMKRLRILIVRNAQVSGAPKYLPNNLRVLEWKEYPSPSLPDDFHPEALVVLNLPNSHLTLDQPFKKFENLTCMNFSDGVSIRRLPDVSATPNITRLVAYNCPNLAEIHDSVGNLDKLVTLSTEGCPKLKIFPPGIRSTSLEYLSLAKCFSIQSFPDLSAKIENMKNIDIEGTAIKNFPNSIGKLNGLEELDLTSCTSFEDLPFNTDMFQTTEDLNVEGCPQFPKLLRKSMVDRTNWTPKLNRLVLKNCDLLDEDLELILSSFLELKWLNLSNNNFVTIPDCIEDLANLVLLHVDNCKQLRDISVLPPYLQYIDARNCVSLTPESSDVLLSQAFQEVENIDIVVLRTKIPTWFDRCTKGGSVAFWVRRKFPRIAVFFLLEGENETGVNITCEYCLLINGVQVFQSKGEWPVDHVWLFDLRIHFTAQEWHGLNEHLQRGWNHVEISCTITNQPQNVTVKCSGVHLYKDRMNIHHVSFISPDHQGFDMAYEKLDDGLEDIYDESSKDVVFNQVLGKLFDKSIIKLMEGLQSSRRIDDGDDDELEELDSSTPDLEETSDKGKDARSSKIFLGSATEAEQKSLVTSIADKEPMLQKKGKLKKDGNLVLGSTATASTSTNRGGLQVNEPSNIKVSENDTKSIQNLRNQAESNAEAKVHLQQDKAEKSHTQLTESRGNEQSTAEIEGGLISMEAIPELIELTINKDNIDAFYASLEAETMVLSHLQDTQTNTVSVKTRPSEETQNALQILRDFISKKFSLLLHPGRCCLIKDILEYLLGLSPDDGISLRTKSVIQQLSRSFTQWSLEYEDTSLKLESAGADLSKVDELKQGLEANVREFGEVKTQENVICSQLADLQKRKRELEEEINAIKADIADFTSARVTVAERKREVFNNGRMLKIQRDELRNRVPRLKAEQELAKITQANIEDEWSKLGQQFIESSSFED